VLSILPIAAVMILQTTPCPVVTRGPTSTIRVVSGPSPCNDGATWSGWNCVTLESTANSNGVAYQIECRWNLVDQPVAGSWIWLAGGSSGTFFREGQNLANQGQDQLAATDSVRSIETRFAAGRGVFPQNGDRNLSIVYAEAVQWLADNDIAEGVTGAFASSAGSVTIASALAYHGLEDILDGAVFGAGPTFIDLDVVCAPGYATDQLRQGVDARTYWDTTGQTPCAQMRPDLADPSFDCMSVLGSEADKNYPDTIVHVMVGETDPALFFIDPQTQLYISRLTAEQSSWEMIPGAPHLVLKTNAGLNRVLQRIREIVATPPINPPPPADDNETWGSVKSRYRG
jgi:hypothetical protein